MLEAQLTAADNVGHGDDADQAATDVVEPRPDDKKDTDKTPDNI